MKLGSLTALADLPAEISNNHVAYERKLCLVAKSSFSRCRACIDACPTKAISHEHREVVINKAACVGCGACVAVCAAQALVSLAPSDRELATQAAAATIAAGGIACFVCARKASKRDIDPEKSIRVDCLSRVDEALMVGLAAHGAQRIILLDGDCSTCRYHTCGELADALMDEVNEMLVAFPEAPLVERTSTTPEELAVVFDTKARGYERRSIVSRNKGTATEATKRAVSQTIKSTTGIDVAGAGGKGAAIVSFEPNRRHDSLLDALDRLGEFREAILSSRRFAALGIDAETCIGCRRCVAFCPTGALRISEVPGRDEKHVYLEFSTSHCTRCGHCIDGCTKDSVTLKDVHLSELFDFEPRLIEIPKRAFM